MPRAIKRRECRPGILHHTRCSPFALPSHRVTVNLSPVNNAKEHRLQTKRGIACCAKRSWELLVLDIAKRRLSASSWSSCAAVIYGTVPTVLVPRTKSVREEWVQSRYFRPFCSTKSRRACDTTKSVFAAASPVRLALSRS